MIDFYGENLNNFFANKFTYSVIVDFHKASANLCKAEIVPIKLHDITIKYYVIKMSTFFLPPKYTTNSKPQSNMDDGILNGSRLSLYSQTSNFHALRVSFIKKLWKSVYVFFSA